MATDEHGDATNDKAAPQTSIKYSLEYSLLNGDERSAVHATYELLTQEGEANAATIKNQVYSDHDAGYDSIAEWKIDCIREDWIPPRSQTSGRNPGCLLYRLADEGPMSSGSGADIPDEPLGPQNESDG